MMFLSHSISEALPHLSEKANINSGDLPSDFAACNYLLNKTSDFIERIFLRHTGKACPRLEPGADIQLRAPIFRMALKSFTSYPDSAGLMDRFLFSLGLI
jgi:hypothetical protein